MSSDDWLHVATELIRRRNLVYKPLERLLPAQIRLWEKNQMLEAFLGDLRNSFRCLQFETAQATRSVADSTSAERVLEKRDASSSNSSTTTTATAAAVQMATDSLSTHLLGLQRGIRHQWERWDQAKEALHVHSQIT
jgi:hypothetical protein